MCVSEPGGLDGLDWGQSSGGNCNKVPGSLHLNIPPSELCEHTDEVIQAVLSYLISYADAGRAFTEFERQSQTDDLALIKANIRDKWRW
mgnify:CR=1 FL=1